MKNSPVTIINMVVSAAVGVILSQVLILVFTTSIVMGFIVLLIYVFLGVIAYRAAHVHTRRGNLPGIFSEDDLPEADWLAKYPNG